MARMLEQIMNAVELKQGMTGRMRLVVRTGMPRKRAVEAVDSPNLVARFKTAASDIIGVNIDDFLIKNHPNL